MTDQEVLIVQMGITLQSLHADEYDESKGAKYWQDLALSMRRCEAELAGFGKTFEEDVARGHLRSVLHQMAIAKAIAESTIKCRVNFGIGVAVGAIVATLLCR